MECECVYKTQSALNMAKWRGPLNAMIGPQDCIEAELLGRLPSALYVHWNGVESAVRNANIT